MKIIKGGDKEGKIKVDDIKLALGNYEVEGYIVRGHIKKREINYREHIFVIFDKEKIFPQFFIILKKFDNYIEYKVEREEIGGERDRFEYMVRGGIDIDKCEEMGYREFVEKLIDKVGTHVYIVSSYGDIKKG